MGEMKRPILDACCGSRMFWFNKENPNVLYADIRKVDLDLNHGNRTCHIRPDKVHDFRKMDFPNNYFWHVIFDPPHLKGAGKNGYMAKKYGSLDKNWAQDLKDGFDECMRVLKPYGTLIFKWNEESIKVSEVIKALGSEPLYGHRTRQTSKTIWMAFMKLRESQAREDSNGQKIRGAGWACQCDKCFNERRVAKQKSKEALKEVEK